MAKSILVIEDDKALNGLLVDQLCELGYEATGVFDWQQACLWLDDHDPDLVLLDQRLPDAKGEDLIPALAECHPVIIVTAYGSIPMVVTAMQRGASDYLVKPINLDELDIVIKRVLDNENLKQNYQFLKTRQQPKGAKFLVGHSQALCEVDRLIDAVAPSDMTVLIHGESGVGKELVARELHERSERASNSFVALDCCTIQESLFETELFGHEKGSFTGAERKKLGLIEVGEKGTLFLDEIGEIGPAIQAKLLRVLETGHFRRVGGTRDLLSDVRIIAATNRNLEDMVKNGEFRQDLFYRLNAFSITMPPLRDRREDIPDLIRHFLKHHDFSRPVSKSISPSAVRTLVAYDWPGNVRELKNAIERAIILSGKQGEIRPEHVSQFSGKSTGHRGGADLHFDSEPTLEQIEKDYLDRLLVKYSGHRSKVASVLGVSERNIYRLIKKHELRESADDDS